MFGRGGKVGQPSGIAAQARRGSVALAPGLLIPMDGDPPNILLRGYTLGTPNDYPQNIGQDMYQVRDNFSMIFDKAGQHEIKTGLEYMYQLHHLFWDQLEHATIDAQGGPIPGNIEDLFPVWNDWTTWNLAALSPITRFYRKSFGSYNIYDPRDTWAAWLQDNWAITKELTLNLGLRYDVSFGSIGDRVGELLPFRSQSNIKSDTTNFAPRLGFAYTLPDKRTVVRGGWGRYYAEPLDNPVHWTQMSRQTVVPTTNNDGRASFAADPYNGQIPTKDSILAAGAQRDLAGNMIPGNGPGQYHTMYSNQASIGFQRQLSETMGVEADYAYIGSRREVYLRNSNLTYNPATGVNYSFSDVAHLANPNFGLVRFKVAPDLGGEYTLAAGDQRHRAVVNGIWQLKHGLQLSGLYFFGSGLRYGTAYGGDLRGVGVAGVGRLRPDGTLVPRNNFVGKPLHRVDFRAQQRIHIVGRGSIDGMFEVFNVFNHANYGSYTTVEALGALYGQPSQNSNVAYQPRMLQLGFRFAF